MIITKRVFYTWQADFYYYYFYLFIYFIYCDQHGVSGSFPVFYRLKCFFAFEVTCTGFLWPSGGGRTCLHSPRRSLPAGRLPVAAWPPPSFCSPPPPAPLLLLSLLLLLSRYCSSSSLPVPPGSMKKDPLARHRLHATMGRQLFTALMCWYWDIFSYQIWIMHLIFLATLLVSILSPWLHPSLASSGTYRKSPLASILSLQTKLNRHLSLCVWLKNDIWRWAAAVQHRLVFHMKEREVFHLICGVFSVMVHEADHSIPASFVQLIKDDVLFIMYDKHI